MTIVNRSVKVTILFLGNITIITERSSFMKRTYLSEIVPNEQYYQVSGFVEHIRNKRTMAFLVIRDHTGKMQVTIDKEASPHLVQTMESLTLDSTVTMTGNVISNPYVKLNSMEMIPDDITVHSIAAPLPIQSDSAIDHRLNYRWIDLRAEKNYQIFQIQSAFVQSMRNYLVEHDFIEIHSPKLIGAASESGSDVFEVNYFESKAYLAQSPQFYKQMAMASGFDRIFEVGPVFRAEKSYTNRHTSEFTGFDLELSYIDSYEDVMVLEEQLLAHGLQEITGRFASVLTDVFQQPLPTISTPFPRITLKQLYIELKNRYGYKVAESEQLDLTTEGEQLAYRYVQEVHQHEFLFVTDFPYHKRAFYHMRDGEFAQGYDLIWRGVEITSGAQREHRYKILKQQSEQVGLSEDVKDYLEFFRYGCPPHGGFGIGIDRLTMLLLGLPIKEAMYIFRGPNHLHP